AKKEKPKMIVAGASAYSRTLDFAKFREIADAVDAYLFVDMAHIAGLVATGDHPNPVPYADFVTTTTNKTLRSPRGGMIFDKKEKPKMIVAGASAYSRTLDFTKFREIADAVDAYLFVDMAHIAGLVATGDHPNPVPYADFVTTTTHKTLRGPRGGMIFAKEE